VSSQYSLSQPYMPTALTPSSAKTAFHCKIRLNLQTTILQPVKLSYHNL